MKTTGLWLLPALAIVAGCSSQKEEKPAQPTQLTFHEEMKNDVDLHADEVWEIGNSAIGDKAGIDASKMTDAKWDELAMRADKVQQAALRIAMMDPIVVAKPGVKIGDEGLVGGHTAAQVQAEIDKDPQKLRDLANTLARHMGDIASGARKHDAAAVGPLIDQLDGVCESCHLEFWYPDQKEEVERILGQHV
ncbi:MAG: cytochrome c [Porphyrobacter sp.]|nr:cytochrome c [Porphyrobacter sp.]